MAPKTSNVACLLLILVTVVSGMAQEAQDTQDTLKTQRELQLQLQRLSMKVDSLGRELDSLTSQAVTDEDFERILLSMNEDDQEFTDENRRSKRKALDSLMRAAMEDPGQLSFSGQMLNVFQWDGRFDNSINTLVATVDLFAIASISRRSLVFINLQGVGGQGPAKYFGSFTGFHAGASTQDRLLAFGIHEAWFEYQIGRSSVIAGKIDLTNYFDPNSVANDEYSQFISRGFVNNTAFVAPANSPGMAINLGLEGNISILLAAASNDNSGDQIFDDLFYVVQIGKAFWFRDDEVGAVRILAYNRDLSGDQWGMAISWDMRLVNQLYFFGRYGKNLDDLALNSGIDNALSVGLQLRNYRIFSTAEMTFGLAYAKPVQANPETTTTREEAVEGYVRLGIRDRIFISPHFQHIRNGAAVMGDNISIYGLRVRFAF